MSILCRQSHGGLSCFFSLYGQTWPSPWPFISARLDPTLFAAGGRLEPDFGGRRRVGTEEGLPETAADTADTARPREPPHVSARHRSPEQGPSALQTRLPPDPRPAAPPPLEPCRPPPPSPPRPVRPRPTFPPPDAPTASPAPAVHAAVTGPAKLSQISLFTLRVLMTPFVPALFPTPATRWLLFHKNNNIIRHQFVLWFDLQAPALALCIQPESWNSRNWNSLSLSLWPPYVQTRHPSLPPGTSKPLQPSTILRHVCQTHPPPRPLVPTQPLHSPTCTCNPPTTTSSSQAPHRSHFTCNPMGGQPTHPPSTSGGFPPSKGTHLRTLPVGGTNLQNPSAPPP